MATKTIQEQIAEMENRCAKLEELQKLFEKAVKNEFGIEAKKIHEYSCAMKSHFRKSGNQMSGKWKSSYASLLA